MTDDQNLIKEVDEEVRQDNYKRLWNKYKKIILISISTILICISLLNLHKYNKEKRINQHSNLFFQALEHIDNKDFDKAKNILKDINLSQASGYSDLSFLFLVNLINEKKILLDLNNLELNKKSILYELSQLQKFNNQINVDINNIDNLKEIIDLTKPSSNWRFLAHELLASYYIKKGDNDNAIQSLKTITDSNDASEYLIERAKTILEMIKKNK